MEGCHERRFVAFNDVTPANSKYKRETFFTIDGQVGRENHYSVPAVEDEIPDYFPDREHFFMQSLKKGYVTFQKKSGRKPLVTPSAKQTQFY